MSEHSRKSKMKKGVKVTVLTLWAVIGLAQVPGGRERWVRIGDLQNQFTACGFERAYTNSEYIGMRWPAEYSNQDNSVIERSWIGATNFTDAKGKVWEKYGVYFDEATVGATTFPVVHRQIAKFARPKVYVDGIDITSPYVTDVDSIDSQIISDRIVDNVVNTSMGLTMHRRVYAFSQQYHDDYFIKVYTYTNTGNTDYDDDIELTASLTGVRIGECPRYSTCREGATKYDNQQSWGKFSWVTKRGEDYVTHYNESITEANPIVDWLRVGLCWAGQSDRYSSWDNIGAPDLTGNGRLCAPQFAAVGILHVDKSASDHTDDPQQPMLLGWHASDAVLEISDQLNPNNAEGLKSLYNFLSGNPYPSAGMGSSNRFWETYTGGDILDTRSPWLIHNDVGGTAMWILYGPFDIPHDSSITIVEVEAINGLSRLQCETIGARWLAAYKNANDKGPFILPDGSATDNLNQYKNAWVYTGMDSVLETVGRAKRAWDVDLNIPQPPLPPKNFSVNSGGDRITLTWSASDSETEPDFVGYKIFRSISKPDTFFQEIYTCPKGVYQFDDITPVRGFAYYYYIQAYNDGSNNSTGTTNPTGALFSSRFYTRTTEPAYLQRPQGTTMKGIRVVPNPFNISARDYQFTDDSKKIMFYNIPGQCVIKIYTERGELINTIHHTNGSGDEAWNSMTSSRQVVAPGIYIAYIEVTRDLYDTASGARIWKKGDNTTRKIIIVR